MSDIDVWEPYEASDVDLIREALMLRGGVSLPEIIKLTNVNKVTIEEVLAGFMDMKFIYYNKNTELYRWNGG
ncbi:hypothetical protein LCGC14_0266950 [marine sediment metagenome]|uniref:DprA winged helix domain-containing protein n=1 Tax=marine sediment metagenome TaxID=412755 RepID=A0A0F9U4J4_9ZZZZ